MRTPFERWSDRIAAANDDASRRALLTEIAGWRAGHLTDIPALRQAASAISRLYMLLSLRDDAVREARSLMSLCQTAPEARDEELAAARAYLASLGEAVPALRPSRRAAPRDPVQHARDCARSGRFGEALQALKGRKGPRTDLLRTWVVLLRALARDDEQSRTRDLRDLELRLRQLVGTPESDRPTRDRRDPTRAERGADRAERPERAKREPRPPAADDPLAMLLGAAIPRRVDARLRQMEDWLLEHPDQLDELTATALRQHVQAAGAKAPAPWLAGFVGRVLAAGEGSQTQATLDQLQADGVYAVTAYKEWAFVRATDLLRDALAQGWSLHSLRRGVLNRGEPVDRKLWTLRLVHDELERMLVLGASTAEPYRDQTAEQLAARVAHLCPRSVFLAPGDGNAGLRAAAVALGMQALAADDDNASLLQALLTAEAIVSPQAPSKPRRDRSGEPPATTSPAPHAVDLLHEAVHGPEVPQVEVLVPLVAALSRSFKALVVARDLPTTDDGDADQRLAALLTAIDRAAPPEVRLAEGTAMAVRRAAKASDDSPTRQLLLSSERFGGPGIREVVALAGAALAEGWEVFRVLRGPTARERREAAVLDTLADELRGLWRLLLDRGEERAELWFFADFPATARAGVPPLLQRERARVVVIPVDDPDLLSWYGGLPAPPAIGWTGEEINDVREALRAT